MTVRITALLIVAALASPQADARAMPPMETFQAQWEMSCIIRRDKLDYVLPTAMRRNDVDMWIVFDHGRGTQPLMLDFGIETAYGQGTYIFYDSGEGRVERYSLGGPGSSDFSTLCGAYDPVPPSAQGPGGEELSTLQSIVFERDPQRIAVNIVPDNIKGEAVHIADGLSYKNYNYLVRELGEKYEERFVSSLDLITDFHGEHVAGEIVEMHKVGDITRRGLERALSNEVIEPGKTTYRDVYLWLEELRETLGLRRTWVPGMAFVQQDFRGYQKFYDNLAERVIQRGDLVYIDWGLKRNNFATDMKRTAYVLKEGETGVPADLQRAWNAMLDVREIIRRHVRVGRTGREQLDELKQLVRDAGYVYTEQERASDVPGIEVNIGMHGMGNIAHDMVASLFEIQPELTEYEVRPNAFMSLEFRVFSPSDQPGYKILLAIEDNVMITERGIEWLYPPQDRVLLVR
ncbi:MAG: M24 family metallopeptidase [Gammaproteobacteria bacterium]|nr:M24 family metallopeptidase [Gammaproteobacteria bacterium]MDE0366548.1 M24 family metallopeptidase [Gammaproteobacteria bacterium]